MVVDEDYFSETVLPKQVEKSFADFFGSGDEEPIVTVRDVGGELIWRKLTVRSGFFTNFSSAPEVKRSAFATPPRVHMFGVSLSVGYRWRGRTLSLGVLYSFGRGKASALTPEDPAAPNMPYGPVAERRDYVYFFISGYQAILKQSANRIKIDWSIVFCFKRSTKFFPFLMIPTSIILFYKIHRNICTRKSFQVFFFYVH